MVARLNGVLGGILSAESFTLSQSYYYGSINHNPAHAPDGNPATPPDRSLRGGKVMRVTAAHRRGRRHASGAHGTNHRRLSSTLRNFMHPGVTSLPEGYRDGGVGP